jgi:hypothetical protein
MIGGRPRVYDSVDDLDAAIQSYFFIDEVDELEPNCGYAEVATGKKSLRQKPTVTGLALHLGFASKQSLYDYEKDDRFSYPIKRALSMIEQYHEERLSENNVTGAIFALKNMGWRDKTEVEQSGGLTINWKEERTYETK